MHGLSTDILGQPVDTQKWQGRSTAMYRKRRMAEDEAPFFDKRGLNSYFALSCYLNSSGHRLAFTNT